jgi:predicted Rossmann fold flavoprotein
VVGGLERNDRGWKLNTNRGPLAAAAVVMATGGLSVPSTGSDGSGIAAAKALGHTIRDTYPALTPLTSDSVMQRSLAGLSLPVRLRAKWNGRTLESNGGFLFTHGGYSGPAILDISHVAVRSCSMPNRSDDVGRAEIRVAWTTRHADEWQRDLTASTRGLVVSALARHLPLRLAEHLMQEAGVPADRRRGELRRTERTHLVDVLTAFVLPWTGSEGYKKAEVTGGGVALDEVNPRTLESRRHAGLYLCGEMLDAFGPIGGHNFSWAWATGRAAGIGAAAAVSDGGRAPA